MKEKIEQLGIASVEADTLLRVSKNINKDYKKLLKGYPIQYLIGYSNFYGIKIKINKHTLIPRFETETLVEKTLNYIIQANIKKPNILDMCTGSGCIAIALKKEIKCRVIASDISPKALLVAKYNSNNNNLKIKFVKSNLFKNINKKYDVIISNPPYVKKEDNISKIVKYEPHIALYAKDKGNYYIKHIINGSKEHLKEKGIIAIEINNYDVETIKTYAESIYPNSIIKIEKDLSNKDRFLFIINE